MKDQEKKILEDIMEDLEKESKEKKPDTATDKQEESVCESDTEEQVQQEKTENPETEDKEESKAQNTKETKDEEKEKKPLFGKKEKKDPLKEKLDEIQDKYVRQVAEFDNFRKRTDKEKAQMFDAGAGSVIEKMLPIVDNFERVTKKAKFRNTLLKQFVTRLEIYEKQEFDYDIEQVKL